MNREILKVVNRVLSEEISGRISNVKRRIFEEKSMCSECGVGTMYEGECSECGYTNEGDIQELGGMDDGHPRFGKRRLPKRMSPEDIEKILRGDDEDDISFEDDNIPNIKKMKRHRDNRDQDEINEYSPKDEIENNFSSYEEFCSQIYNMDDPRCEGYYRYTSKLDDEKSYKNDGEIDERLYGNQKRIDKNKNGRIDREDFKMLRKEMYELTLDDTNEKFIFTENEIIGIIENVILEEKKKSKSKTKSKDPIKLTKSNQEKSKKENDDNINMVVKMMKDQLKNQSKGEYEMYPKHFPKGNGELAKMDKMAYVPSDSVEEYIKNFTAAGLENLYFGDGIKPDEQWMTDNIEGSSRTGNNPKWANAVETPVNKERNTIRKNNMLAKLKQKAYNKAPQPVVSDNGGSKSDKASKIMMNLESTESKKVLTDVDKMKSLMGYTKNTQ
jgi:hypothetical protein